MAKAQLEEQGLRFLHDRIYFKSLANRAIADYMIEQNRPYSANDVFTNLRQEYGKTVCFGALRFRFLFLFVGVIRFHYACFICKCERIVSMIGLQVRSLF